MPENTDGIMLRMNEDGTWAKKEEPYTTIECPTEEDYNSLIKATEKQIPMKPTEINNECGYFVCPACEFTVGYMDNCHNHNYCLICGQKLDWDCGEKKDEQQI